MGYRPAEHQLTLFGADPHQIIREAWEGHGHRIIRRTAMLSGGNDSSTLAHWLAFNGYIDELLFLDTGIGIGDTAKFVRRFADHLELPLEVWHAPPGTYERMVTTISGGFPGPAAHSIAYQRLKERPLREYIAYRKRGQDRHSRVLLFSGLRRVESVKRMKIAETPIEPEGGRLWVAPFLDWTAGDLSLWRERHDIPRNPVADLLHYSGECLCGANAAEGELDLISVFYPKDAATILRLQSVADRLGIERSRWGENWREAPAATGPACSDCQMRITALADCPVAGINQARQVKVSEFGIARPMQIAARVHSPGRTPGPEAFVVNGVLFLEIDEYGVHLAQSTIGRFAEGDGGRLILAAPNGVASPARELLEKHHGSHQTAIDFTCWCECKRVRGRLPDSCRHNPGLAVWMLTDPLDQLYRPFLTLGPIRLTNSTGRSVFDRIRVIDRVLLLQDDPCGRLCLEGDAPSRMFGDSGFWQVRGVGSFAGVLIGRARDQAAIEQVWRSKGIDPGYRLPSDDPDYYEPVTVAAKYPGDPSEPRLLNALPADLWTPQAPTPQRKPPVFARPTMQTRSPLRERRERAPA
jgi:3'-phosphoadenosine 5'-phosphosulfate sulfotransferase (PAPS reductase)/FAD synthetase